MSSTTPTKEGRDDEGRKDNGKFYNRVGDRGFKEGCDEINSNNFHKPICFSNKDIDNQHNNNKRRRS